MKYFNFNTLLLSVTSSSTSLSSIIYGYLTINNFALIIGILAGIFSIIASVVTIKRKSQ